LPGAVRRRHQRKQVYAGPRRTQLLPEGTQRWYTSACGGVEDLRSGRAQWRPNGYVLALWKNGLSSSRANCAETAPMIPTSLRTCEGSLCPAAKQDIRPLLPWTYAERMAEVFSQRSKKLFPEKNPRVEGSMRLVRSSPEVFTGTFCLRRCHRASSVNLPKRWRDTA